MLRLKNDKITEESVDLNEASKVSIEWFQHRIRIGDDDTLDLVLWENEEKMLEILKSNFIELKKINDKLDKIRENKIKLLGNRIYKAELNKEEREYFDNLEEQDNQTVNELQMKYGEVICLIMSAGCLNGINFNAGVKDFIDSCYTEKAMKGKACLMCGTKIPVRYSFCPKCLKEYNKMNNVDYRSYADYEYCFKHFVKEMETGNPAPF